MRDSRGFYTSYLNKITSIEIKSLFCENWDMRIAIIGYSGSGKSTLCRFLGEKYGIPMLHFDTVQFLPNWEEREVAE